MAAMWFEGTWNIGTLGIVLFDSNQPHLLLLYVRSFPVEDRLQLHFGFDDIGHAKRLASFIDFHWCKQMLGTDWWPSHLPYVTGPEAATMASLTWCRKEEEKEV